MNGVSVYKEPAWLDNPTCWLVAAERDDLVAALHKIGLTDLVEIKRSGSAANKYVARVSPHKAEQARSFGAPRIDWEDL